jgi:hypothetical protein
MVIRRKGADVAQVVYLDPVRRWATDPSHIWYSAWSPLSMAVLSDFNQKTSRITGYFW